MRNGSQPQTSLHPEVFLANKFWIEIGDVFDAFFTECSGLAATTEVFEYKEGGFNTYTHKLPVRTSFSNITLKHGMTLNQEFWKWFAKTRDGSVETKDISIVVYSDTDPGTVVRRWNISKAYPIKWSVSPLTSKGTEYMVETLELAYQSFEMIK